MTAMCTHFSWKRVPVDGVLRSELIVKPVVDMDLLELIFVGQWTPSYVYVVPRVVVHSKYHTVSRVSNCSADLKENLDICLLHKVFILM